MFAIVPIYNATDSSSINSIINTDHIETVEHGDTVNVNEEGGPVPYLTSKVTTHSGKELIILLDIITMQTHLKAIVGEISEFGYIS